MMILKEGGNVFKDPNGQLATQRINQADVAPTLAWLEKIVGLDLQGNTLGTTGKAPTSGDLDVAIECNNDMLRRQGRLDFCNREYR